MEKNIEDGNLEQKVIVELVACMARNWGTLGTESGDGRKGTVFLPFATFDVEFAVSILLSLSLSLSLPLRVAMPVTGDGPPYRGRASPRQFELLVDVDDVEEFLAEKPAGDLPPLVDVIAAFVALESLSGKRLSVKRRPFVPAADLRHAMNLLTEAGFAARVKDAFAWTDDAFPIMRMIEAWNKDGQCYEELWSSSVDRQAEDAWRTMPPSIKDAFFATNEVPMLGLVKALVRYWKNGEWSMSNHGSAMPDHYDSRMTEIAKKLAEIH